MNLQKLLRTPMPRDGKIIALHAAQAVYLLYKESRNAQERKELREAYELIRAKVIAA